MNASLGRAASALSRQASAVLESKCASAARACWTSASAVSPARTAGAVNSARTSQHRGGSPRRKALPLFPLEKRPFFFPLLGGRARDMGRSGRERLAMRRGGLLRLLLAVNPVNRPHQRKKQIIANRDEKWREQGPGDDRMQRGRAEAFEKQTGILPEEAVHLPRPEALVGHAEN